MFHLYKLIGSFAAPPGLFILILLLLSLAALRKPCRARLSAAIALFAAALYLMSTSAGACLITGPLETQYAAQSPDDAAPAAIIVLAGGSSYDDKGSSVQPGIYALERLYAAVRLANKRGGKTVIIMSGGNVFGANDRSEAAALSDAAREMGWSGENILEVRSRTTAENLKNCAAILKSRGIKQAAIVTNAFHIPRSMQNAARCMPEIQAHAYPSGRLTDPVIRGLSSFLPNAGDLATSCIGIREYVGIAANSLVQLF